jgi:CheY-like chemotaxis protein
MHIDDNDDDQFLIHHTLKKIGVTDPIHLLSDGAEAIEYMMGEGKFSDREEFAYPTFIITDLKMPRKDGFAVLEFLKGNPEWAVIPTIVFSSSTDLDDIKKAYMLGASSYHVKPRTHGALMHHADARSTRGLREREDEDAESEGESTRGQHETRRYHGGCERACAARGRARRAGRPAARDDHLPWRLGRVLPA